MGRSKVLIVAMPLIIVLAILVAHQYGYKRFRAGLSDIRESQELKTKTLGKYLALIAEKPVLEKRLASLKETRKANDSNLVEGQTTSLAAATLEEMVKTIVTSRGGTISSERVNKPEDLGAFKVINISIDAVMPDARALSDILYSIETRTPHLVIKELDARVRNYQNPKELTVKLDVSAMTGAK